jgi:hypothetical protein
MNMDTYGDDCGSKNSRDTNNCSKGLGYHVLEEDEIHDGWKHG